MSPAVERHDVVVVGGGISGLVAANRAAQAGLDVLVLEKGIEERYLCSTRYTGGTFHIGYNDVAKPPADLVEVIRNATGGFARDDVARAVATDGIRLVRWLQAEGIRFLNLGKYHTFVLAPPSRTGPGLDWEGRGGDVLLRTLEANLGKRGGRIRRGARAVHLERGPGGAVYIDAQAVGAEVRFEAKAVVLADGGFPADTELLRLHITPTPDQLQQRNARTATGDGLRMAQAIGAATVGMDCFYGHLLSRDAMTNDRLWPRPYLDALAVSGIVVDRTGNRFADEGRGGVYLANVVARLPEPLSTTLVFDKRIWDDAGTSPLIPANPHLVNAGGTLHSARSIGELAALIGAPADALENTVARYNDAIRFNAGDRLSPKRRGDRYVPQPIITAPFYGVPLCSGITNTMGGIVVDGDGAVLDTSGISIGGVFAVGATTGGLEGGPEIGYVGGLIKATLGLRAAERIAALLQAPTGLSTAAATSAAS